METPELRKPTAEERQAITAIWEGYEPQYVAVFPNYISDGPGYVGPVMVAVGGGAPELGSVFVKRDGEWQLEANFNAVEG